MEDVIYLGVCLLFFFVISVWVRGGGKGVAPGPRGVVFK